MTGTQNLTPDDRHHVVVVGGGFGGIQCIKSLKRANVRITLVDQRNHHLFQPLLYQVATTILAPSEIAWPLRQVFRHRKDVTTLMARVLGVNPDAKRVALDDGSTIDYDTLVLATGAQHSYFGNSGWEEHAPGLKTLEDATTIRRGILSAFEALAPIADEVGGECEIICDGGIRRGTHVLKALARGATSCSMGRPYLFGLAAGGQAGVAKALELLRAEIERDMGLLGCTKISDISSKHIA